MPRDFSFSYQRHLSVLCHQIPVCLASPEILNIILTFTFRSHGSVSIMWPRNSWPLLSETASGNESFWSGVEKSEPNFWSWQRTCATAPKPNGCQVQAGSIPEGLLSWNRESNDNSSMKFPQTNISFLYSGHLRRPGSPGFHGESAFVDIVVSTLVGCLNWRTNSQKMRFKKNRLTKDFMGSFTIN